MSILRIAERKWKFAALQRSGMNSEKALAELADSKIPYNGRRGAEHKPLLEWIREPSQPSGEQGGVPRERG